MTTTQELHLRVHNWSKERKVHLIALRGQPADLTPMIIVGKGDEYLAGITPFIERDAMIDMLIMATALAPRPDVICCVNEGHGWIRTEPTDEADNQRVAEEMKRYERGQFKKEFEQGLPGRFEFLITSTLSADAQLQTIEAFSYKGNQVEWGKATEFDSAASGLTMTGFLPDAMRRIFEAEPDAQATNDLMEAVRGVNPDINMFDLAVLALDHTLKCTARAGTLDDVMPRIPKPSRRTNSTRGKQ